MTTTLAHMQPRSKTGIPADASSQCLYQGLDTASMGTAQPNEHANLEMWTLE